MGMRLSDASVVEVYGRDSCPFCVKAKKYIEDQNIPVDYLDISEEGNTMEDVSNKLREIGLSDMETPKTIPQIFCVVDGKTYYIGGFKNLISIAL